MDEAIKAEWTKRLRSGDYEQGTGALRSGEDGCKFCCLGVLTDMAVEAGLGTWDKVTNEDEDEVGYAEEATYKFTADNSSFASVLLPLCVLDWAGLTSRNPVVPNPHPNSYTRQKKDLAELNDEGNSFDVIADLIAKHL